MAERIPIPKKGKNIILNDCDEMRARMLRNELQKVRLWFSGWEAAGKMTPPGTEALRQMVIILDHSFPE